MRSLGILSFPSLLLYAYTCVKVYLAHPPGLYGVTIHQVYRYFRAYNTSDPIGNKLLVCALTVLETLHTIICTHARSHLKPHPRGCQVLLDISCSYFYLVTSFGKPEALTRGVWYVPIPTRWCVPSGPY
ncbi:hypothetical protein BD413DRAFT_212214 [Trametes elegans]|nr:hypothetical protein BD413DRAFT_212214 [Trametes elegans]